MKQPFAFAALAICLLRVGPATGDETTRSDILFADFEGSDYGAWQASGTAFGSAPVKGTLPGQMPVSGFLGQ
ncbi:MAG TPA: hypothetical protein VG125_13925, partial [Pirellulales bacterium]|nr:hypothetical protein [Pirellulales bacterium]